MSEEEKSIAWSCLSQVKVGMTELRQLSAWWRSLSEVQQAEFSEFLSEFSEFLCVVWACWSDLRK